jgi:hypothetical protein
VLADAVLKQAERGQSARVDADRNTCMFHRRRQVVTSVTYLLASFLLVQIDFGRGTARIHLLRKLYPHESQARPLLARSLHTSCTDIFPCGASSVATSARPRLIACCTTLAYVVSHRPSVTTSLYWTCHCSRRRWVVPAALHKGLQPRALEPLERSKTRQVSRRRMRRLR